MVGGINNPGGEKPVEEQARQQTGRGQVRLAVDERNLRSTYANAFRSNATAEEVMLDFGTNQAVPVTDEKQPNVIFQVNERVIMNYYSAKRLAMTLTQVVRRYEEQFGEIELDVSKRGKGGTK